MKRANDIKQKLAFSLIKYKSLCDEMSRSQRHNKDLAFVGQKVGDILSGCRECFDYCAKDLADSFLVQGSDKKLVIQYASGKAKAYFPFFETQLLKGALFYELIFVAPELYAHLLGLAKKIAAKEVIAGTVIGYDLCEMLNDIVNCKKHDQITVAKVRINSATHVTFPDGGEIIVSPMFPFTDRPDFSADVDAQPMVGSEGVKIKYAYEYRISHNNWEVGRFCLYSIQAVSLIISEIYQKFFEISYDYIDPWETIKPENVKKGEHILRLLSPIVSRPLRIVLLLDDMESANIEMTFEGLIDADDLISVSLAKIFMIIFENHFNYYVFSELTKYVMENWEKFDPNDRVPKYFEMEKSFYQEKNITIDDLEQIKFNKILFGIGIKFCCNESIPQQQKMDDQSLYAAISIIDSELINFNLYTDSFGRLVRCNIQ
ncbi:hypothetical protein [Azospirillum sp. TSH64]|uniref:hypothetical protein n=1 Tax=Azospirillum sp. TSH64 TaxID=652740 RepID=UPI0011B2551E|nr:hypothetical protein [Azospirillum sp. TSH64]